MSIPSVSEKVANRGNADGDEGPGAKEPSAPPDLIAHHASPPGKEAVSRELEQILASPSFHSSKRSQEFLTFVVRHRLEDNHEPLKERTIGTLLFKRPPNYATGEDSVVRVQAGEVRRRLEQYYQSPLQSQVRIELPLGSYTPEFRWLLPAPAPVSLEEHLPSGGPAAVPVAPIRVPERKGRRLAWISAALLVVLAVAIALTFWIHRSRASNTALNRFWSPMFASNTPLLICLPKPIFYRPSPTLYGRHELRPHEFDNEVDRMNGTPHLQPDEKILWGDMVEYSDFGVSKGDVKAAFRLSAVVTRLGKDSEVRVGNDYSWDDLRSGPSIVIGAFSNPWTMKITSGLHFSFAEDHAIFHIQEQGAAGHSWYDELDQKSEVAVDYGLVTRLVNTGTGQFTVLVAGITAPGSEAAAEVAGSADDLQRALGSTDWTHRNLQIVVKTSVIDGVAGPAQIAAVYVW